MKKMAPSVLMCAGIVGCSRSDHEVSAPPPQLQDSIVVLSSSFEANGIPTLEGWVPQDTSLVHFSADTPPGGGSFSLEILGWSRSADWVVRSLPTLAGPNYLRVSFSAKRTASAIPFLSLGLKRGNAIIIAHPKQITDTVWTSYSMYDTLVAEQGDSLWIRIDGGGGEIWGGTTFYDLITLRRYY